MRKICAFVMLCIGIASVWAADTFCEQRPFTGRYTAAPADITDEQQLANYPVIWVDVEHGCFSLSFGGMFSYMGEGTCTLENGQLVCWEFPERYRMFSVEDSKHLRYIGSEQPRGTPLEAYYAALLPDGEEVDFAERLLEGKVLRYLDEQTILEGWAG